MPLQLIRSSRSDYAFLASFVHSSPKHNLANLELFFSEENPESYEGVGRPEVEEGKRRYWWEGSLWSWVLGVWLKAAARAEIGLIILRHAIQREF